MNIHNFTGFKFELIPNCAESPMILKIDGTACLSIELPSTGEFHIFPADDVSDYHVVMFKMNGSKNNPPEVSFHVLASELETFKKTSVLPVIS
ncbi:MULTISPECIES: hypothetical protein [unclassified Vibrio]|uniref:hypothetical protein n=1 Tax=unclassified Vibrio TaxID=2614977 RepID=UPI000B8EC9C8|nr:MULTISPECIES: hypothetical protein [unclassified Vibrio]NAW91725.1 hypothetical protein [Vibrio sp. V24_P1S3T111]OXX19160.1 hypothetical protein B9J86_16270 [Vibrio sp. V06_P1A73T115]OXX24938.1 hypothetical protein B9J88_04705 [Vibrio sp. V05_P4A8T149]OXX36266.1 hypothetical protein B9J81_06230 [Vibrio sp. V04_P4A5T148]OXX55085.1 hypothetical protein B9J91_10040 [Vibrio sp. V18_P1S4T112]